MPAHELDQVPEQVRRICLACPGRLACLEVSLTSRSVGYWGGTTRAQRRQLDQVPVAQLQARLMLLDAHAAVCGAPAAAADELAQHAPGAGGFRAYRRGCRCSQCRAGNTAARALERARAVARAAGQTRIAA